MKSFIEQQSRRNGLAIALLSSSEGLTMAEILTILEISKPTATRYLRELNAKSNWGIRHRESVVRYTLIPTDEMIRYASAVLSIKE